MNGKTLIEELAKWEKQVKAVVNKERYAAYAATLNANATKTLDYIESMGQRYAKTWMEKGEEKGKNIFEKALYSVSQFRIGMDQKLEGIMDQYAFFRAIVNNVIVHYRLIVLCIGLGMLEDSINVYWNYASQLHGNIATTPQEAMVGLQGFFLEDQKTTKEKVWNYLNTFTTIATAILGSLGSLGKVMGKIGEIVTSEFFKRADGYLTKAKGTAESIKGGLENMTKENYEKVKKTTKEVGKFFGIK